MFFSKGTPVFRGAIQIVGFSVGCLFQPESNERIGTKHKLTISPLFPVPIFSSELVKTQRFPVAVSEGPGHFSREDAGRGFPPIAN